MSINVYIYNINQECNILMQGVFFLLFDNFNLSGMVVYFITMKIKEHVGHLYLYTTLILNHCLKI